jgi:hypothetical protein
VSLLLRKLKQYIKDQSVSDPSISLQDKSAVQKNITHFRKVGFIFVSLYSFLFLINYIYTWNVYIALIGLSAVAVSGVFLYRAATALRLSKRINSEGALEALGNDPRRPIIYLRPFALDGVVSWWDPDNKNSKEQIIAQQWSEKGPFIAIGKPGEIAPELGAARLYISDLRWKEVASIMLSEAQVILFRPASMSYLSGSEWEFLQCLDPKYRKRVRFIFFGSEYKEFMENHGDSLGIEFPKRKSFRSNTLYFMTENTMEWE